MGAHSTYSPPVVLLLNSSRFFFTRLFSFLYSYFSFFFFVFVLFFFLFHFLFVNLLLLFLAMVHLALCCMMFISVAWRCSSLRDCMESLVTGVIWHCCRAQDQSCASASCSVKHAVLSALQTASTVYDQGIAKHQKTFTVAAQNKVHNTGSTCSTTQLKHIQFHFTKRKLYVLVVQAVRLFFVWLMCTSQPV